MPGTEGGVTRKSFEGHSRRMPGLKPGPSGHVTWGHDLAPTTCYSSDLQFVRRVALQG
jgi:hypothetical protein